jgi:hypothetical protein
MPLDVQIAGTEIEIVQPDPLKMMKDGVCEPCVCTEAVADSIMPIGQYFLGVS